MVSATSIETPRKSLRQEILLAAFEEFYLRGYQAGSINNVIKTAGSTKGALFHHFNGKKALGMAVLDEVILPRVTREWLTPLTGSDHPIETIMECFGRLEEHKEENVRCGCPLSNLAHEMSPLDEDFRLKIDSLYSDWRRALEGAFERGKVAGNIRPEVDTAETAAFVIAAFIGIIAYAKNSHDMGLVDQTIKGLVGYFSSIQT